MCYLRKEHLIVLNYNIYKNYKQFIRRPTKLGQGYLVIVIEINTPINKLLEMKKQVIEEKKKNSLDKKLNIEIIDNLIKNRNIKIELFVEKQQNKALFVNNLTSDNFLLASDNFLLKPNYQINNSETSVFLREVKKILKEVLQKYDIDIIFH